MPVRVAGCDRAGGGRTAKRPRTTQAICPSCPCMTPGATGSVSLGAFIHWVKLPAFRRPRVVADTLLPVDRVGARRQRTPRQQAVPSLLARHRYRASPASLLPAPEAHELNRLFSAQAIWALYVLGLCLLRRLKEEAAPRRQTQCADADSDADVDNHGVSVWG
ncbi:hypothetical protein GGX14DRAFT_567394 [Mycena pura]|uniref:Uncharacterized protein n=1 Tax=Mycena pura TaxID=153505 RepID=A0AAD6VEG9_9AGAR|nr:hypothetical protein GGX14DRAFT_567394 [Mycena pura]